MRNTHRTRVLFAGLALVLKPFGPVTALLKNENPWRGFQDDGPVLTVLRAQKIPTSGARECEGWVSALSDDEIGRGLGVATSEGWNRAVPTWGPWKKEELEGIQACKSNPCDVKLNEKEALQMGAVPEASRFNQFLALALDRVHRYQKNRERKEYEFAGDPVDPWKQFDTVGLTTSLTPPPKLQLELRRVDFFPGKVKTLHQVFDTRIAVAADHSEVVLWRRDVYSDHYFDGWGEWAQVTCQPGAVTVVQTLVFELDLMKKTDLVSRMLRSKMRGAAEENGAVYLDRWFERLRKHAVTAAAPIPSATPQSSSH